MHGVIVTGTQGGGRRTGGGEQRSAPITATMLPKYLQFILLLGAAVGGEVSKENWFML